MKETQHIFYRFNNDDELMDIHNMREFELHCQEIMKVELMTFVYTEEPITQRIDTNLDDYSEEIIENVNDILSTYSEK